MTVKNLVNLMLPYQDNKAIADVINQLNELKDIYNGIEFNYTYKTASTDEENKTTTINSTSTVDMSPELLAEISARVEAIRSSILN